MRFRTLALAAGIAAATLAARAEVPQAIHFQGALLDAQGDPVAGPLTVLVGLYRTPELRGGVIDKPVYAEEHASLWPGPGGVIELRIGTGTPLKGAFGPDLFAGELWVELGVDGEILEPRVPIDSVAFAMRAQDADALGGRPPEDWQPRVVGSCAVGSYVVAIEPDGDVVCNDVPAVGAISTTPPLIGDGSGAAPLAIAPDGIGSAEIAPNSVGATELKNSSVSKAQIIDGSIDTYEILNDSILHVDIKSGAVRSSEILDGSIGSVDLANGAVTNAKLASNSVTASKIASNAVGASEIASGAVRNAELGLSISTYQWNQSNNGNDYTADIGVHNFCAVTSVVAGSPVSGTDIRHIVCAVYPSSLNPGRWTLESHGTVLTRCTVRCF